MGARGEEDRLERWAREHGRAVLGFLLQRVRRCAVAEELLQEVFCRALQAREHYTERGLERAYLLRIADRLALDHLRRAGRERNEPLEWETQAFAKQPSPLDELEQRESSRQLREALQSLSDSQRRVLLLRYFGELSFVQIAEALGCPLGTALSHCRRGLASLRKLLEESLS